MKKDQCRKRELRSVKICIRVTPSMSKFIKDQKLSPSMIMWNALEELGWKSQ